MICAPDEAHVWRIKLDHVAGSVPALEAVLSPEELERARRFRSVELREQWTTAHWATRHILAAYSQSTPSSLTFRAGPNGKPRLANLAENASFNLSHTRGLAMVAIAGKRVGIDAEAVRSDIDIEDVSRRFFAPVETEEILTLSSDARIAAFFACWTRKEAFIKALGDGLSMPLDSFRVSVRADQPARLVSVGWGDPNHWSLIDLGEPGFAATLAVEVPVPLLRRFDFVPPQA